MSLLATLGVVAATQWTGAWRSATLRLSSIFARGWRDPHAPAFALDCGNGIQASHHHDDDGTGALHNDGLVLMAVPKRKTSHARKRLRHKNKWLQNIQHLHTCPTCQEPVLFQRLCGNCLKKKLMETAKMRRKGQ